VRVLLTNDDGVAAPGLAALAESARKLGEVTIVAPAHELSGVAHAVSITRPIRYKQIKCPGGEVGYAVDGTPADCVKLAVSAILPRPPELVISGINAGNNVGINALYSGTVAAALEAAMLGLPAFAISLDDVGSADFTMAAELAREIALRLRQRPLPTGTILNVNVPGIAPGLIKGIKLTHQSNAAFTGQLEKRSDPKKRDYFWVIGEFQQDPSPFSDLSALRDGYVAITPLQFDLTDYALFEKLKNEGWEV